MTRIEFESSQETLHALVEIIEIVHLPVLIKIDVNGMFVRNLAKMFHQPCFVNLPCTSNEQRIFYRFVFP